MARGIRNMDTLTGVIGRLKTIDRRLALHHTAIDTLLAEQDKLLKIKTEMSTKLVIEQIKSYGLETKDIMEVLVK